MSTKRWAPIVSRKTKSKCLPCNGKGIINKQRTSFGAWVTTCPRCLGEGKK